jgi:hypothetical protein
MLWHPILDRIVNRFSIEMPWLELNRLLRSQKKYGQSAKPVIRDRHAPGCDGKLEAKTSALPLQRFEPHPPVHAFDQLLE